jgi:hypothetical protein
MSLASEYLTTEAVDNFNIPIIPIDTVVLSFKMTLGRVGITSEEMLSNEAIAHFKFNGETPFIKEYLYLFLKTYPYQTLGSTSSIVTSINSKMIKELMISIPDKQALLLFEEQVKDGFLKIKTRRFPQFYRIACTNFFAHRFQQGFCIFQRVAKINFNMGFDAVNKDLKHRPSPIFPDNGF